MKEYPPEVASSIKLSFSISKSSNVSWSVTSNNDQETDEYRDDNFNTYTIDIPIADLVRVMSALSSIARPSSAPMSTGQREFGPIIGEENLAIIADYWTKNVDPQINVRWLNRTLNDCEIPLDATGKQISDLLKQAYFRVLDQFASKGGAITAPRVYARKVIISVFAGD